MVLTGARGVEPPSAVAPEVIWHDLECGSYTADLALWRELAAAHPNTSILDVGAGTGRVSIDLARLGRAVIALDSDPLLLAELNSRAPGIQTVCADARCFTLEDRGPVELCLAPMQTVQLFAGRDGRIAFLGCVREQLSEGGLAALAIVDTVESFDCRSGGPLPTAERKRVGDVLYSSQATRVQIEDEWIVIERQRTVLTPAGCESEEDVVRLDRVSAAQLSDEAAAMGLRPDGVRRIGATTEHTGCEVVLLRG
jgi:SAM-dependent methyltransferase